MRAPAAAAAAESPRRPASESNLTYAGFPMQGGTATIQDGQLALFMIGADAVVAVRLPNLPLSPANGLVPLLL